MILTLAFTPSERDLNSFVFEISKQSQHWLLLIVKAIQIHWFLKLQKQSQHLLSLIAF